MKTVKVWVQLLDEGSPAIRGTEAIDLGNEQYQLIQPDDYDAEDEVWEFLPGSIVRCALKKNFEEKILLAIEKID